MSRERNPESPVTNPVEGLLGASKDRQINLLSMQQNAT